MRLSVLTIVFTLMVSNLFAQWGDNYIELSHKITTETKNLSGFDKIDVSEDFEVILTFSDDTEKVVIEANENLHELINVEQVGRTLKIDTKSYSTRNRWGKKGGANERLVAHITAKNLSEIVGDEDVTIEFDNKLTTDKLSIFLSEDCTLKGKIAVQNLVVELDEDSVLDLEGTALTAEIEANEDSMVKGYDFEIHDLDIRLKDDSEAKLTVNGDIRLRAHGDSEFFYKGKGTVVSKRLSGDAEMKHW